MPGSKPHHNTDATAAVRAAALDQTPIAGLTHRFYRYPARFSPAFAGACIEAYSKPGQIVLDPYMGGGTTVLEAMVKGRRAIGSDINSLSVFVARAKVTELSDREQQAVAVWSSDVVPSLRCDDIVVSDCPNLARVPRNMTLPEARWLRKTIALCLSTADAELPTARSRSFARCVLLNVGQWALNGRRRIPAAAEFRARVATTAAEMLAGMSEVAEALNAAGMEPHTPVLRQNDAEHIDRDARIRASGLADLVVTSPPYPGIHMLYHRWQVDGRKETDAPYWIAACNDGCGASFYNFADRRRKDEDRYFDKAEASFAAIRRVMKPGAILAQMVAFAEPARQLRRYLGVMERAGFFEMRDEGERRIWRDVPGRKWHASYKGELSSSREVVLVHFAT
jgi:DNA modification methylase